MITLTAALFVGGLSSRMGRDKALLEMGGERLWEKQLRLLRELHPDNLVISARSKPEWCPADVEVVLDNAPSRGPLSGLHALLERVETSHLLTLAVDLPRMTAEQLQRLWKKCEPAQGVVPMLAGRFEPLCAIYPREAAFLARTAIAGEDVSLQSFVRKLEQMKRIQVLPLDLSAVALFHNVNSPADLQNC